MILLLDMGNTCLKWAFLQDEELIDTGFAPWGDKEFKDIAKAHLLEVQDPERVLVSNVAGPARKKSANLWIKRRWPG